MRRVGAGVGAALAWLAVCGCAPQVQRPVLDDELVRVQDEALTEDSLRLALERWARVVAVGYRLRTGAAALCGDRVAPVLGLVGARRADLPRDVRELWERHYGTDDRVAVLYVLPSSPAAAAGVQEGDRLLAVNGRPVRRYRSVSEILRDSPDAPVKLTVARHGDELQLEPPRVVACDSHVDLAIFDGLVVVLQKNEEDLVVTTGLVRFVRSDDELAIALARAIGRSLIGDAADGDGEKYAEADRLGLQLAARAGFDVSVAPAFWDRIALEQPASIECTEEFPGECKPPAGRYPERSLVIQSTVREILDHQRRGEGVDP